MNFSKIRLILVGLILTVCTASRAQTVTIATGQKTGTYFKVGKALSNDVNSIEVVATNGSIENLQAVEEGTYDFSIVQSDIIYYLREQRGYSRSKVIGSIYQEPVYILIRSKLRLSKIGELRGKRVAVGLHGSGTRHTSETILGIFGISLDELKASELTYNEIAESLSKETIDAAFVVNLRIPDPIQPLIKNNSVYCLKMCRSDLTKIASANSNLYTLLSVVDPKDVNKQF